MIENGGNLPCFELGWLGELHAVGQDKLEGMNDD